MVADTKTSQEISGDLPSKYIRTLAGDMEIVKRGGTPDLTPFVPPTPVEKEVLVSEPVLQSQLKPEPKIEPEQELEIKIEPLLKETELEIELEAIPPQIARPIPLPPIVESLKTYSGDFSSKLKEEHASTATVLAAEQDAAKTDPKKLPPQKSANEHFYIIAGALLLLLGTGGTYYAYLRYTAVSVPVTLAPVITAPIAFDENEQVVGTGISLMQMIEKIVEKPLAVNSVRLISFEPATTSGKSVFSALNLSAPDILLRNIHTEGSIAGVLNSKNIQSPFFILSAASFSETFAGMLSWEPKMAKDLAKLYPPYAQGSVSTTTVATTTVATNALRVFKDEIVSNHDVRVYRDAENRAVFLYGYWNQSTLIIARNEDAFSEIVQRLANARTQ